MTTLLLSPFYVIGTFLAVLFFLALLVTGLGTALLWWLLRPADIERRQEPFFDLDTSELQHDPDSNVRYLARWEKRAF
jgi:hypothetical protein